MQGPPVVLYLLGASALRGWEDSWSWSWLPETLALAPKHTPRGPSRFLCEHPASRAHPQGPGNEPGEWDSQLYPSSVLAPAGKQGRSPGQD